MRIFFLSRTIKTAIISCVLFFFAVDPAPAAKKIILSPITESGLSIRSVTIEKNPTRCGVWKIFDLAGRYVASIEVTSPGNPVNWSGFDSAGNPLPSRPYIAVFSETTTNESITDEDWIWTKNPDNPVLQPGCGGQWDSGYVRDPSILDEGDTLKMWYTGFDESTITQSIGYAYSIDGGNTWNCLEHPVLEIGEGGSWDSWNIEAPVVIHDNEGYTMYYAGFNGTTEQVGRAESADGLTWTKDSENPVLKSNSTGWDNEIGYKSVIKDQSGYHMWYAAVEYGAAVTYKIGYAESSDGRIWTKYPGNPITGNGEPPEWEKDGMSTLSILSGTGGTLEMFYSGVNMSVPEVTLGYATSSDSISWTKDTANPFLVQGPPGSYDSGDLTAPSVIPRGNDVQMAYSARSDLQSGWIETIATADRTSSGIEENHPVCDKTDTVPFITSAFPNPFNPVTTIHFHLESDSSIKLSVYSLSGKLVKVLADGRFLRGNHFLIWNGLNSSGMPVSSGVYICVIKSTFSRSTYRIVMLK